MNNNDDLGKDLTQKANCLRQGWIRALNNQPEEFCTNNSRTKNIINKILKARCRREIHVKMGWC